MKKILIAIDSKTVTGADTARGIGFHTKNLLAEFNRIKELDFKLVNIKKENLSKYDLVHYQKFHPYFFSFPFIKKTKSIITIHDLIYLIYPKKYPSGIKGRLKFLIQKFLIRQMDAIVTISETSKKDIVRLLGVNPNKVNVIYLAPRIIFRKIVNTTILYSIVVKYKLPKKFVLYVGDVNYNKNIPVLLKACKEIQVPLVICGKQAKDIENQNLNHPELKHLKSIFEDLQNNKNVIRLGFVPDEDLVAIYNLATVYVQPSLYEGFGLPVLEAFACGTPVVSSKTQCLVEVAENAAIYVDPFDYKDFVEKITLVINDQKVRNSLILKGQDRVKEFSWQKTAIETLNVYKKVLRNE